MISREGTSWKPKCDFCDRLYEDLDAEQFPNYEDALLEMRAHGWTIVWKDEIFGSQSRPYHKCSICSDPDD